MTNPLIEPSSLKQQALPFDKIKVEHFLPALEACVAKTRRDIEQIKKQSPSFAHTIEALLVAQEAPFTIAQIYHSLRAAHGDDAMQSLAKEIMPRLVELDSDINLDEVLFAQVKSVYDQRDSLKLSTEQMTLLEKVYRGFRRGGALLGAKEKEALRKIDEELSTLGPQFSQNVLSYVNRYQMVIEDEKELAGLPESARAAAKQTAEEKGIENAWVFTLHMPSVIPFMQYADSEARREELWRARGQRAFGGDYDNRDLVKKIASLRHKRAKLLGYESHAAFQTEERMAETPARVFSFLEELIGASKPAAQKELEDLGAYKKQKTGDSTINPWDYAYWAEKLKAERFDLDPESIRPYFRLEQVLDGAFEHARRLYHLRFTPVTDLPVYHPDVKVFEVTHEKTGAFQGLFYADFFPRDTKSGGAWCTRYRGQWKDDKGNHRPHVSIVCNFTKPTGTKPSLLTFDEVRTLFHEFGHALHSLLSDCQYQQLACTNVYRDFVELPSQIMENWLQEEESLNLFATHYETGEKLPVSVIEKLKQSDNFHAAMATMRQLKFGVLDMAWYGADPADIADVAAFEKEATKAVEVLPTVPGINISCSFEHIFSGGYSAGYYGYKWAEALDADAYELFREKGIFSPEVSQSFCDNILAKGGSEHPMVLYKRFRGREPDPKALLRRYELI